jgi:transposase
VSDEEWAFVVPDLTLMTEDAPQRHHDLREVFNGLRWLARTGAQWRILPHDLPSWYAVYQQAQRWLRAGVFEAVVHDLRRVLREAAGRAPEPTAVILDGRTIQSTPESGAGAEYDGHERRRAGALPPAGQPLVGAHLHQRRLARWIEPLREVEGPLQFPAQQVADDLRDVHRCLL